MTTILQYVATHRSRIVLLEGDDDVRAVTTASWLRQIGRHKVFVLGESPHSDEYAECSEPALAVAKTCQAPRIWPAEAARLVDGSGAVVIDAETSLAYREGHLPGATFAMRAKLPERLDTIIVTSSNGLPGPNTERLASG